MSKTIKTLILQFVLFYSITLSNFALADVRTIGFESSYLNIQYDWNVLTNELTNFKWLDPRSNVNPLTLTSTPPDKLGDRLEFNSDIANGGYEYAYFWLYDIEQDPVLDLYTHIYVAHYDYIDPSELSDKVIGVLPIVTFTQISPVPAPAALPLMASALGLFGIARRRRNH